MRIAAFSVLALVALAVAGSAARPAKDFNPNGFGPSAVEGVKWSGTVANFTDTGAPPGSSYEADIDWGDGTKSSGSLAKTGKDTYDVNAEHNFVDEGKYQMRIRIQGGTGKGESGPIAEVVDAPLALKMALPGGVTEGGTLNGTVATFNDGNSDEVTGAFKVTIDWGDGSTGAGSVAKTGPGAFSVSGSHAYGEEGQPNVKVTVNDVGGSTATGTQALTLGDAPLTAGAPLTVLATERNAYNGAVATFKDTYASAPASDYTTVTIDWGDGKFTPGTVTPFPAGGWPVRGTHVYAEEGQFSTSVVAKDKGGATVTIAGFAKVADAPLHATGIRFAAQVGETFRGVVATFSDAAAKAPLRDYGARIDWGDGRSSEGKVVKIRGRLTVTGSHTYAKAGRKSVIVKITDRGGAKAAAPAALRSRPSRPRVGELRESSARPRGRAGQSAGSGSVTKPDPVRCD